ncbi:phosphatidylinositol 3- and 4-kinase, partial [Cooperia oncophora]
NEDVRQDSLVEQLFSVVNGILNRGEPSAFLRTYKVVPLDSKCGIIEFCQGTVSLKELLCGTDLVSGLHLKEEPFDRKALQVRTMLKDAAKTQVSEASKMFRAACAVFKPVFRHFFYGQHSTVHSWAHMIDNYRRSLAQWSIVTYVVGLGDRHLSNVLFETDTCKLVHIDLGMILEYSKRTLPIPERVPFRLTRDLLDPILIEGTDGRLGEDAVRAMRLLRESKHVILGLASVLLRETISNFEEVESSGGERPSFVSETAIARLRDKLEWD